MRDHVKRGFSFGLTVFIPLLYLLNVVLIAQNPNTMRLPFIFQVAGLFSAGLGILLWVVSMVQLGKSFGVLPQKQKKVTQGLYKYFKHPMYIGILLAFLGLSVASQSLQGMSFTFFITLPMLLIRAHFEEKALQNYARRQT